MPTKITGKTVFVYNPLPAITDEAVLRRAGLLELTVPAERLPLIREWQYSAGSERENLVLNPGQRVALQEMYAVWLLKELREQGVVSHEMDADETAIRKAALEGFQKAIRFHAERGAKRLTDIRKRLGYSLEEMIEHKHEHYSFYHNQAIADMLREEMVKLATPKPVKVAQVAEAAEVVQAAPKKRGRPAKAKVAEAAA